MSDDATYETDWALVRDETVLATGLGAVFGAGVGIRRLKSAPRYALVAATQMGLFGGSYVLIREGYRHLLHVKSWGDDWVAVNTVSAATGAALFGSIRSGYSQRVFMRSFTGGSLLGLGLSLLYLGSNSLIRRSVMHSRGIDTGNEPLITIPDFPKWLPFRKLTEEEREELKD